MISHSEHRNDSSENICSADATEEMPYSETRPALALHAAFLNNDTFPAASHDAPDIREIVTMYFGLDPDAKMRGCASGKDGLAAATQDVPDLILLDIMMPVMDGPTTLARLRENPRTTDIPFVFMTARAQAREIEQFKSLGAADVSAKPFDPMTLAASVCSYLYPAADKLAILRTAFHERVVRDSDSLLHCLSAIVNGMTLSSLHRPIRGIAHSLAGAGGIFGYPEISDAATSLERVAIAGA